MSRNFLHVLKLPGFIGTIANAMTWEEFLALINAQLLRKGITPAHASRLAVGNPYLIYNIRKGRKPSFDNLQSLCRVLELDFIGPPRPPASSLFNRGLNKDAPPPDSALAPVADRDLAEILALLADEYEALNDHGRRQLAARFRAAFPELRGGAPLRRVIRYLGWDVIEAPAPSARASRGPQR